jgi:hypothetical protein
MLSSLLANLASSEFGTGPTRDSLYITDGGDIGLGPRSDKEGDIACTLPKEMNSKELL